MEGNPGNHSIHVPECMRVYYVPERMRVYYVTAGFWRFPEKALGIKFYDFFLPPHNWKVSPYFQIQPLLAIAKVYQTCSLLGLPSNGILPKNVT